MKILSFKNNCFLNYNQNDLDFYKNRITEKISPPDSFEIVQSVIDELDSDNTQNNKNKILYKIGKTFENAGAYQNAKNFYEKIKQNTSYDKTKKHQDIDFDIERVIQKDFEQQKKEWEA